MKNNNNTPIFSEGKINPNKITKPIEYKNK